MKLKGYFFDPPHVLGLRPPTQPAGEEPNIRHELGARQCIKFDGNHYIESHDIDSFGLSQGELTYLGHAAFFRYRKGKSYAFNKDFLETLIKSEIKQDISAMFPDSFTGYFALPTDTIYMQNNKLPQPVPITGIYISIVPPKHCHIGGFPVRDELIHLMPHPRYLWFTALTDLGDFQHGLISGHLALDKSIQSLDDMLMLNLGATTSNLELLKKLQTAVVLMLLYVNTAKPDLRLLKPASQLSKSQITGLRNKGLGHEVDENYSEDISTPVELVSWGWNKPDLYTKERWEVPARFITYWTGQGRTLPITHWLPPTIAKRNPSLLTKREP